MKNTITTDTYFDKVYGGWFGKCLGGASGAKLEGFKTYNNIKTIEEYIDKDIPNDDLDIQLLWLDTIEEYGLENLTPYILAKMWEEKCWYPFSEYGYFLRNFERGILPPQSGVFNNSYFKDGMGAAIRSEIWAFMNVGRINNTIHFALMDAQLDHSGDGALSEVFLAALEGYAFFESDALKLLEFALGYIDKGSKLFKCVSLVIESYRTGATIEHVRNLALRGFGHPDFTNCVQNLAFIVISLLYGEMDIYKSIHIALSLGYDTDCTAASVCAVLGIIKGYSGIDSSLKGLIDDYFVCGIKAKSRGNSVLQLSKDTIKAAERYFSGKKIELDLQDTVAAKRDIELLIDYKGAPSFLDGKCEVNIIIENNTDKKAIGRLNIYSDSSGFEISCSEFEVCIGGGESEKFAVSICQKDNMEYISNGNGFTARLQYAGGVKELRFGVAGYVDWRVKGVFFDCLDKPHNENHPPCHGEGCFLPSLECMVNNYVSLDKQYIDENDLSEILKSPDGIIRADEDIIPVTDFIQATGQVALYIAAELDYGKDEEVWAVIGNSDGYRFWVNDELIDERDEIRCWTPYNNCAIIKLKKGVNSFVFKLLRRTDEIKFSFGLRKYEGVYWHRNRWIVDYKSKI